MKYTNQIARMQKNEFEPVNVFMDEAVIDEQAAIKVVKKSDIIGEDEATFARWIDSEFQDGVIEVKVLSRLLLDAPDYARGFSGIAFRINEDNSEFECFYIRPTNGRCDIQLRRNRSTQYFSYPNFKYFHSRESNPGEYESYADMGLNEWISIKIVIDGAEGKLFLNDVEEPVLIVKDLKHGADRKGALGLFVDIGTEGYFKDLKIKTW